MLNCIEAATDGFHVILDREMLEISHEKARHNIVGCFPVNQACPIVVDKPAGDLIAILHVEAEVLLPMPVDNNLILILNKLGCSLSLPGACLPGHVNCMSFHIHCGVMVLLDIFWIHVCDLVLNPVVELT